MLWDTFTQLAKTRDWAEIGCIKDFEKKGGWNVRDTFAQLDLKSGHFCTSAERSRDTSAHLRNGVGTLLHIYRTESGHFCTSTERSQDTSAHLRVAEMKGMGQFYTTGEHKIRKIEKEIRC